jgi:hypothetical protein
MKTTAVVTPRKRGSISGRSWIPAPPPPWRPSFAGMTSLGAIFRRVCPTSFAGRWAAYARHAFSPKGATYPALRAQANGLGLENLALRPSRDATLQEKWHASRKAKSHPRKPRTPGGPQEGPLPPGCGSTTAARRRCRRPGNRPGSRGWGIKVLRGELIYPLVRFAPSGIPIIAC